MIDKDSTWNWNNGLITLITTLFQLNFAGYNYILPDIIGGNQKPNKELFIRWLQVNTFMPSLQFSYPPWMFDNDNNNNTNSYNNDTNEYDYYNYYYNLYDIETDTDTNNNETIEISHKYLKLHDEISDYIIERFNLVIKNGEPVNPPIWWLDPTDLVARQIYDGKKSNKLFFFFSFKFDCIFFRISSW